MSFKIVEDNLRGENSASPFYQKFKRVDVFHYQCSGKIIIQIHSKVHSTSNEIDSVFKNAILRQQSYEESKQNSRCVVFLDEVGLPESEKESLKILHYYLDHPQVAFVGITNDFLDAAKANRASKIISFLNFFS